MALVPAPGGHDVRQAIAAAHRVGVPFPADILPTCLCETVEMVALYEAVWRPNGHHRHGLGRLVMKGSGVRFPASAPKLRRKSRISTKRSVGLPKGTEEETVEGT